MADGCAVSAACWPSLSAYQFGAVMVRTDEVAKRLFSSNKAPFADFHFDVVY